MCAEITGKQRLNHRAEGELRGGESECFAAGLLRGGVDANVAGTQRLQPGVDGGERQFGFVAIAAEVAEVKMAKIGGNDFLEHVGRGVVAEMTMTAGDALFDAPGAADVLLEHFHIMICFEHEHLCFANALEHELGGMTEVGEKTNVHTLGAQEITDRIVSIVRDGKSIHTDFTDLESGAGVKETKIETSFGELQFDRFLGEPIAIDRNVQLAAERAEAIGVIGMFVREENAGEAFWLAADLLETVANLAGAEAGVDQEAGRSGLEIGTIAIRATAENRELKRHAFDSRAARSGEQRGSDFSEI